MRDAPYPLPCAMPRDGGKGSRALLDLPVTLDVSQA
ncbi:hypothetical protein LvStA_00530 [Burkholderia gladioli]|nr:hypothetical protein LvStA_00530 [Burkholderia gladioli]